MLEFPERPDPARAPARPAPLPQSADRRRTQIAMAAALAALVAAWITWAALGGGDDGRGYAIEPVLAEDVVAPDLAPPGDLLEGDARTIARRVAESAQAMWARTFAEAGAEYEPTEVAFGDTSTCPGDDDEDVIGYYCSEGVFLLDEDFAAMEEDWGAEDARTIWALVVAHEIGHHVQALRGTFTEVDREALRAPGHAEDLDVRVELQAECLAGIWAGAAGLDAPPGAFTGSDTHGSAGQQERWFATGRDTLRPADCQAFAAGALR